MTQLNVNDYHIVKVAYPKEDKEEHIPGGTTIVFNKRLGKVFRKAIDYGTTLTPKAFADTTGGRWVSARERLRSKMDINHHTADLLARYYTAVEDADWTAFRDCISDHVVYVGGSWFANDGDIIGAPAISTGYSRGIGASQLLATTKAWRERYNHVRYVLDMTNCMMNQTTAIVSFKILRSENGIDFYNALPIEGTCTSIYQIEDDKVTSLQHMVGVDIPINTDLESLKVSNLI